MSDLQQKIAATLQARLSWPKAEACAADIKHHIDEALLAAKAEAWYEGYRAGESDAHDSAETFPHNPYPGANPFDSFGKPIALDGAS